MPIIQCQITHAKTVANYPQFDNTKLPKYKTCQIIHSAKNEKRC